MQSKRLPLLVGGLVVLLGIAFLSGAFERDVSTIDVPEIDIDPESVTAVSIVTTEDTIALRKDGQAWHMGLPLNAPVDASAVDRLTSSLGDLTLDFIVSSNPDRFGRYGIDSTTTQVTIESGSPTIRLTVSEQGPDFQSTYVRLDDEEVVYATRGRLSVMKGVDAWRDKTVTKLTTTELAAIEVERPEGGYALAKTDGRWRSEDAGFVADSASVARWLTRFGNFRADDFLDATQPDSIASAAAYRVSLTNDTGEVTKLYFAERAGNYAVVVDGGPTVYELLSSRFDLYVPEQASLASDG